MFTADDDAAFSRFCSVAGRDDLAADPRFATEATRAEHRAQLEAALVDLFPTRTAAEWEADLLAAGVGCVVADAMSHFAFLYEDEQATAIDMMTKVEHPSLGGSYWRYSPVLQFSATPSVALPFCELGEHTDALLAELGYDGAAIDALRRDAVVA
jgi:crotonobetainyl-CoA:carnitine CoA-transferase CaiB-like acyl-CoA transferase